MYIVRNMVILHITATIGCDTGLSLNVPPSNLPRCTRQMQITLIIETASTATGTRYAIGTVG